METTDPPVSIVIPAHDRVDHLRISLKSISKQTYRPSEVIIVDDRSVRQVDIVDLCRRTGSRYLRNQSKDPESQRALCRNLGLSEAEGEIIVFSDTDVILPRDTVEKIVELHGREEKAAVCGQAWLLGKNDINQMEKSAQESLALSSSILEYDPSIEWSDQGKVNRSKVWWGFISGLCSFRREELIRLGGWDATFRGWGGEDTELGYRLVANGYDILYCSHIPFFHMEHSLSEMEMLEKDLSALRNVIYLCNKYPALLGSPILNNRVKQLESRITNRRLKTGYAFPRLAIINLLRNQHVSAYKMFRHPVLFARQSLRRCKNTEGSIGVVIGTRNHSSYLRDAVESCLYQTRPPKQVVIVDDASEDNTIEVAQRLVDRYREVHLLGNRRHMGVPVARNVGISACKTDYIMILDSDDLLEPRYFEEVAEILDAQGDVAIACSSYREFGDRDRFVTLPPFDRVALLTDCIIMGCALVRRSVLEVLGDYDPEQIFEDWELWIRIVGAGWNAKSIPKHYYLYRVHGQGKDARANLMRKEGDDLIYEKHRSLYDQAGVTRVNGNWIGGRFFPAYR